MTAPTLHANGHDDDLPAMTAFFKREPVVWQGRAQVLDHLPYGPRIRFSVAGVRP